MLLAECFFLELLTMLRGILGEVYLCQFIFLAHLLRILRYDCPRCHLIGSFECYYIPY